MSIVERQHYVWRKYLEAWCVGGNTLWCSRFREDKFFPVNPINVAVERYFYELTDLTPDDVTLIRTFIDRSNIAELKALNATWLAQYELLFTLVRELRSSNADKAALLPKIDELLTQIEEQVNGHIETSANRYLDALKIGDTSFYEDLEHASKFLIFLTMQYFRTKKMRDLATGQTVPGEIAGAMDRAWPILRHIFATNVGQGIFARRATMKLCMLEAPDGMEFITCDQPVINTYAVFDPATITEQDEFYYPVSPKRAIILSEHSSYHALHGTEVSAMRVGYFNDLMLKAAHEQRFASKKELLP